MEYFHCDMCPNYGEPETPLSKRCHVDCHDDEGNYPWL